MKIQTQPGNSEPMEDLNQRETIGQDLQTQMFQFNQLKKKVLPTEEEQNSQSINAQSQARK